MGGRQAIPNQTNETFNTGNLTAPYTSSDGGFITPEEFNANFQFEAQAMSVGYTFDDTAPVTHSYTACNVGNNPNYELLLHERLQSEQDRGRPRAAHHQWEIRDVPERQGRDGRNKYLVFPGGHHMQWGDRDVQHPDYEHLANSLRSIFRCPSISPGAQLQGAV